MPWRGAELPGEFPTLGAEVAAYIEASCAIPDGDHLGEPFALTDEQFRFLLWHYRLDPKTGRFVYRRSQLVRPQKWGKGPLSAAMICAEAEGPVLFAGWNSTGEPVGRPWATPWIQVTAVSEDQTDNVWRALLPMIELGAVAAAIPDTGLTRINLPAGGYIEPVTASARSRLGQRITFAVQDETHSWLKTNGGIALADNQRRNLAGMNGRSVETTNAWNPADGSVAQLTFDSPAVDIYRDFPAALPGSFHNKRERRRSLKAAYGDSHWIDIDRIDAEVEELQGHDPAQAERFFGNRLVASADTYFDLVAWKLAAHPGEVVAKKTLIALGFDGSMFHDATVLHGCRLEDGHLFVVGYWEGSGVEVNRGEVDAAIHRAFRDYRVVRFYADPPYFQDELARWYAEFGDAVLEWWTNRNKQMAEALERLQTALLAGECSHDNDRRVNRHVANARREDTRSGTVIRKPVRGGPEKIDGASSATLAYEARADAIAAGALRNRPKKLISF